MTKKDKIELLMKFIKGEIPFSTLKQHKVVFFMYMTPEQLSQIEDITGPAESLRSQYMPDGECIAGLFDGVPVGFTARWHLSMLWHPESAGDVIAGTKPEMYQKFLTKLKSEYNQIKKPVFRKWI